MTIDRVELATKALELVVDQATSVAAVSAAIISLLPFSKLLRQRENRKMLLTTVCLLAASCVMGFLIIGKALGQLDYAARTAPDAAVIEHLSPYGPLRAMSGLQVLFFVSGIVCLVTSGFKMYAPNRTDAHRWSRRRPARGPQRERADSDPGSERSPRPPPATA